MGFIHHGSTLVQCVPKAPQGASQAGQWAPMGLMALDPVRVTLTSGNGI